MKQNAPLAPRLPPPALVSPGSPPCEVSQPASHPPEDRAVGIVHGALGAESPPPPHPQEEGRFLPLRRSSAPAGRRPGRWLDALEAFPARAPGFSDAHGPGPLGPHCPLSPSATGISGKSQILFALVFTTRYLDLFTNFISIYNTVMKVRGWQALVVGPAEGTSGEPGRGAEQTGSES